MADEIRMTFSLTEDAAAAIEKIKSETTKTQSEQFKAALDLASWIVQLEDEHNPMILVLDSLEITNMPYRLARELRFREAVAKLDTGDKSLLTEIYDSAQLKPSFMGVGVDLKPLLKRMGRLFHKNP